MIKCDTQRWWSDVSKHLVWTRWALGSAVTAYACYLAAAVCRLQSSGCTEPACGLHLCSIRQPGMRQLTLRQPELRIGFLNKHSTSLPQELGKYMVRDGSHVWVQQTDEVWPQTTNYLRRVMYNSPLVASILFSLWHSIIGWKIHHGKNPMPRVTGSYPFVRWNFFKKTHLYICISCHFPRQNGCRNHRWSQEHARNLTPQHSHHSSLSGYCWCHTRWHQLSGSVCANYFTGAIFGATFLDQVVDACIW